MRHTELKIIPALLALFLLLQGCALVSEEELDEIAADEPQVVVGTGIGQALAETYRGDDVFSLNSVSTDSFNPYQTTSAWNQVVGMLVYENLVTADQNFTASPNLVTKWQTEDGMNWTFWVDTTRRFHSGGDMTSTDAVYSIQQAMGYGYGGRYARRLSHVQAVYALDGESFLVTLDQPNYRFYELLNIPCIEAGDAYEDMPSGTGPYKFNGSGTALVLDRNHPMADQMPLQTIYLKEYTAADDILQAFEDSFIDLVINNPTDMANLGYSSTNITRYVDTTHLHYLGFNMYSRLFSQPLYRMLMTYAIDRDTIVSDAMQGAAEATTVPIHPNSPVYPAELAGNLRYNWDAFVNGLSNAGAADVDYDGALEFGGVKMSVNFIVCSDSSAKVAAARQITNQLQSAGFSVSLRELAYDDYVQALENGNFDIYYGEVRLCDDWDISTLVNANGELNYGNASDQTLTNYIQSFLGSTEDTLAMNTEQMCQYLAQVAPIVPICFEKSQVLYHRGVLSGLDPTQDNLFYNMQNWTLDLS